MDLPVFKPLKLLAFLLGGLSAGMGAGALFLYATFDGSRLAGDLTQYLRQQTQRTLRLDGPVSLSVFPRPSLHLPAATLSEPRSDGEFLRVAHAELRLRLGPLLSRRVVAESVELHGARIALRRQRDGALNVDDLIALARSDGDDAPPVSVDLRRLVVQDAAVAWQDDTSGRRLDLTELAVRTDRLAAQADGQLALSGHLRSEAAALDADIHLTGDYRLDAGSGRHALRHVQLAALGTWVGRGGLEVNTRIDELAREADGSLALKGTVSDVHAGAAEGAPHLHLALPDLRLSDAGPAAPAVDADLGWGRDSEGGRLTARITDVRARAGSIDGAGMALTAEIHRGDDRLTLQGRGIGGWQPTDSRVSVRDLTLNGSWTRVGAPDRAVQAGGALRADAALGSASGTVDVRMDGSRLGGTWAVNRLAPLTGSFDLEAERLDLDRLFPAPAGAAERRWALSGLRGADVEGQLRIGSLRAGGVLFERVRLPLSLHGGRLVSRGHSASLYGGTVGGNFTLAADGNKAFYTGQLSGVAVGPLQRDVAGRETLSGTLNAFLDVATAGERQAELAGALGGKGRFTLSNGAVHGIEPIAALREWQAAIVGRRAARRTFRDAERAGLTTLSGTFGIEHGVLSSADLQGRGAQWRTSGRGTLDVPAGRLDVLNTLTLLSPTAGLEGGVLASLRGAGVAVRMKGPAGRPEWWLEAAPAR